ncbi:MAG: squalene/phytoene synthase family protein [Planctomycetes bacterium]|nr:squalene/phytoene synthase family protein [Planctomycetota bacterium]
MTAPPHALPLRPILAQVSRSFYVSLWLLPPETRHTVALAYLLARAADTVADTRVVPRAERLRLLEEVAAAVRGERDPAPLARELEQAVAAGVPGEGGATEAERALLAELPGCLRALEAAPPLERDLVRRVLETITRGMWLDLTRFPGEDAGALAALDAREALFDYCYRVAGCVGEFWSDLHAARLPALRRVEPAAWSALGRRFGRALQLTNVLRDVARDLRHGRCYLPAAELAALGLAPADLLDPAAWPRLRPLYLSLVAQAVDDARAGLAHCLAAPPRLVRLRLAGLLPLLLALETLGLVARGNPLDPGARLKVPRRAVWGTLLRARLAVREDRALVALFERVLRRTGLPRGGLPSSEPGSGGARPALQER